MEFANRAIALNSQFGNAYATRAAGCEALGDRERAVHDYQRALSLDSTLISSAAALGRLTGTLEAGVTGSAATAPDALVAELIQLTDAYGWVAKLGGLCASMHIQVEGDCTFRQLSISSDDPRSVEAYGFNLKRGGGSQAPALLLFRLTLLVGEFFVISTSGELRASYYRAKNVDYTAIPNDDARPSFEATVQFWGANLEKLRALLSNETERRR